jgi:hypothetical protein
MALQRMVQVTTQWDCLLLLLLAMHLTAMLREGRQIALSAMAAMLLLLVLLVVLLLLLEVLPAAPVACGVPWLTTWSASLVGAAAIHASSEVLYSCTATWKQHTQHDVFEI